MHPISFNEIHEVNLVTGSSPGMLDLVKTLTPSATVHTAAQPSHDRAASIPFEDVTWGYSSASPR